MGSCGTYATNNKTPFWIVIGQRLLLSEHFIKHFNNRFTVIGLYIGDDRRRGSSVHHINVKWLCERGGNLYQGKTVKLGRIGSTVYEVCCNAAATDSGTD